MSDKRKNIFRLAVLGVCAALSIALIFMLRIPIFPVVPFLEYDPGDIPIMLCAYLFGPWAGLAITVVASVIQGVTVSASSGWIGILMHILATGSYAIVAGIITNKHSDIKRLIIASLCGILTMSGTMVLWNIIITPYYMGVPVDVIISLLPYIIAFNLIKSASNTIAAVILYKSLHKILNKSLLA